MNFFSQLQSVPISAIEIEDTSYCLTLSAEAPGDELLASIKQFGILNPPILRRRKNNTYCIIAGRKRLAAAGILDPGNPVLCRILREDLEETAVFSLLLEEALTGRELSIVEQIIFFEKLITAASMDAAIPLLGKLGHKPQKHILNDLLQLRTLSIPALKALHHGVIQLRNARKLLGLSPGDQELLIQLITDLHFGGSKQQKLIDLSRELIMRKNVPLKDILTRFPAVHEAGQSVNIPQHGAALLSWLHEQCFPRISQAENDFQQKVARLGLPSSMRIDHTPAFENEEIILSLRFPGWRSLDRVLGRINTLMQDEEIN
ncbi:MAG: ParB N-terminal domain-containing protein [Desulfobulbaceae bacterium]|nr:ParB N-terminal domain-containing protein [Desulfobulbaceae bacterium]